jgi:hypothetical protein
MDPTEIAKIVKAAPELARDAYKDLASGAMKQTGQLATDLVKTARLVLFPVQLAAALQDRLAGYVDRAVRQVPEQRLIVPAESVMLPIVEKLRFQEPDNPITRLYINLLARAMDGERIGEAHPAFISVISQLAPDEATFLTEMSRNKYTLIIKMDESWQTPNPSQISDIFDQSGMPPNLVQKSHNIVFRYIELNQPELFKVFLEHLDHLGLVEYTNEPSNDGEYRGVKTWTRGNPKIFFIQQTAFGTLFYKACLADPKQHTQLPPGA